MELETNLIKVLKNGLGEWGIWWKNFDTGKYTHLGYKRFFKSKEIADKWAVKLERKLLKLK